MGTSTLIYLDNHKRVDICLAMMLNRYLVFVHKVISEKIYHNDNKHPMYTSFMSTLNTTIKLSSIWSPASMKGGLPPTTTPHAQHYKSIFGEQKPL